LESYPVNNLRVNLMQSLHLRERNLKVLRYLDYSRFSRSEAHLEAVRALRNGELLSWHGVGEALLSKHSPEALTHFAQRPGYMVRMLSRLLSLDYGEADILRALEPRSGAISGHLVLKTLRTMMKRSSGLEKKHQEAVQACRQKYARERAIDIPDYDQEESLISSMAAHRRSEAHSTYLVQPEYEARRSAFRKAGLLKEQLELSQRRLEDQKRALRNSELTDHRSARPQWQRNAHDTMDADRLYALMYMDIPAIRSQIRHLESEIARLTEEIKLAQAEAEASFRQQMERIHAENDALHRRAIEEIDAWERKELDNLPRRIEREMAEQAARLRDIELRREAELKELEDQHQRAVRTSLYDAQAVSILRKLLRAHFAQADTPLKGKKVFLDMKEFDLEHSVLETEDRSKDGGYIRSGIAYRIPEDAKYVRFFVYWNDTRRIDIDLHAGGVTTDGRDLHVGWNADFRDGGVVHSGDITHSDAAEYIDIDLSAPIREIYTNVHFFNGRSFKNIETCYVGMMAVDQTGQTISRYDPANCFFTHKLTQNTNSLYYGFIDVQNRFVRFVGQMNESSWAARPPVESEEAMFSLREYLDSVMGGQGAELVSSKKEADVVLTMGKSLLDCGVSLADNNFFLEC
ncbi:MAG: hypothetical protein IJE08_11025, partial [Clostridia bacterium]|nr:hypothetical protein [Clostridia bacterium]